MKDTELNKDTTHTADYITGFSARYDAGYEEAKYGTEAASAAINNIAGLMQAIKMVWEISGRIVNMSPVVLRTVFGVETPGEVFKKYSMNEATDKIMGFKMIIRSFLSKKTKKETPPVPDGRADILFKNFLKDICDIHRITNIKR